MKKIISLLMALAVSATATAFAEKEVQPEIKVDGRGIMFREEQPPVIQNDRLYVPVRRVLETMGAEVKWDGEKREVTVESYDNVTILVLTIDNPEITKFQFTSVLKADETKITSDVAPVIINDRTMLPIRVIAEALGATVNWNEETMLTQITTKQAKRAAKAAEMDASAEDVVVADLYKENLPKLSIDCDAEGIKEGDEVKIKVKLADIDKISEDAKLCSTTVSIFYNSENFSYSGFKVIENGEARDAQLSANNPNFMEGCLKVITLDLPANAYLPSEDGTVLEITMTALNDEGGDFILSDGVSELGNNTEIVVTNGDEEYFSVSKYTELYIDTTPITVK